MNVDDHSLQPLRRLGGVTGLSLAAKSDFAVWDTHKQLALHTP